jgi:hypothetical protein
MSAIKKIRQLEQQLRAVHNLSQARLMLVMLLVRRAGKVTVSRADIAALQGWWLDSKDDGETMVLSTRAPTGPVPAAENTDERFAAIGAAVRRTLKH